MQNKNNLDIDIPMTEGENQFIYESYVVTVPADNSFLDDPKKLTTYAKKTVKRHLGDEAEVSKVKLKKPGLVKKGFDRILRRQVMASFIVVTKF